MNDLQPGDPETIGPYRLRSRIGAGGMGVVYLASDSSGREVAIKLIRDELAADAGFRARFAREVRAGQEPWINAQHILVKDILTFVGNDAVLLSLLQRSILVPLELSLIRLQSESGLTEYELVESVRAALRKCLS